MTNNIAKWIKKVQKDIGFENNKEYFELDYLGIQSKISRPTTLYQYYSISPINGIDYIWYDSLNKYFIEKSSSISEKEIVSKLVKFIERHNLQPVQLASEQSEQIETKQKYDLNLEYYTLKSKLTKLIDSNSSSNSNMSVVHVNTKVKELYNSDIVANILVGEFLDLWKWSKTNSVCVELSNNNIYTWRIQVSKFTNQNICQDLEKLKELHNVDSIEFELLFHEKFYPNYPPMIKIIKPNLLNALSHRISNSKMTQLSYWTPTRGTQFIVCRTIDILNRFGRIDLNDLNGVNYCKNNVINQINKHVSNTINNLAQLSSLIDTVKENDEIDNDMQFIKFDILTKNKNKTNETKITKGIKETKEKPSTYWKSGTGYGHSGNSSWNPEEFVKLQKEKDDNISNVLSKIVNDLQQINNTTSDFEEVCRVISNSLLLLYLKQQFKQTTLLDMQNRESIFKLIMSLIEVLSSEKSIYLFNIKKDNTSLYDVLKDLYVQLQSVLKMDKENEFIHLMCSTLEAIVFPMYDEYKLGIQTLENQHTVLSTVLPIILPTVRPKIITDIKIAYVEQLSKLKFDYTSILDQGFNNTSIIPNTTFKNEYIDMFKKELNNANWRKCQKRLSVELPSLIPNGQLPINYEASIFVRVDENNPMIIKALMTGPHDTPYENGCFIFDLYATSKYPETFKDCWFMNTGGNRLNPNLYNSGKVCLSILGTWSSGSKSESWNEKTSSLLQVLVSIQSQILIDEPYFNEPGHERNIGSTSGKASSIKYNDNIRYYTMCSTIRDLIVNPLLYPHFENVVRLHFKLKKQRVLETCQKWVDEASESMKTKYNIVFDEIKVAINKL